MCIYVCIYIYIYIHTRRCVSRRSQHKLFFPRRLRVCPAEDRQYLLEGQDLVNYFLYGRDIFPGPE